MGKGNGGVVAGEAGSREVGTGATIGITSNRGGSGWLVVEREGGGGCWS